MDILICVHISNTFDHHITYLKLLYMDTSQIVYVHLGRISNFLIHVQIMYAFLRYSKFYTHSEPTTPFFFTFSLYVVFFSPSKTHATTVRGIYHFFLKKNIHVYCSESKRWEKFKSKRILPVLFSHKNKDFTSVSVSTLFQLQNIVLYENFLYESCFKITT